MDTFGERLGSMDKWHCRSSFNVTAFAEAGDTLRCAFCRVPVSDWSADDNPWVVNIQGSPRCVHALFHFGVDEVQKLFREQNEDFTLERSLASILRQYPTGEFSQRDEAYYTPKVFGNKGPLFFTTQKKYGDACVAGYRSEAGRRLLPPRLPELSDLNKRRRTLDVLPDHVKGILPDLDNIANSGLFYDAAKHVFLCYYCEFGGFTAGYDPWILHAKHTDCCHVILTKGEPFLEQAKQMDAKLPTDNAAGAQRRLLDDIGNDVPQNTVKKSREVYVCQEEQKYHRKCCGCGQISWVTGALETSVREDYRCADCNQGPSGQT